MAEIFNRYATIDIFIPTEIHNRIDSFVSRSDADLGPFGRQIDLWWAGLALGVRIGVRTPMPENRVKFNTGAILNTDPWRITHLELLALSEHGPDIFDTPGEVILIASEYANTGLQWIMEALLGEAEPTLTFMNRVIEHIHEPSH
jgi:hypothetical protein